MLARVANRCISCLLRIPPWWKLFLKASKYCLLGCYGDLASFALASEFHTKYPLGYRANSFAIAVDSEYGVGRSDYASATRLKHSKILNVVLSLFDKSPILSVPKLSGQELAFYQACMQYSRPPDCRCPQYSGGEMPQLPPGKEGGWSRNEVDQLPQCNIGK